MSDETPLRAQIEQLRETYLRGPKGTSARGIGYEQAITDVLALLPVASAPSTPTEKGKAVIIFPDEVLDEGPSVAPAPPSVTKENI